MQGREREIDTLSAGIPQPHTTNLERKRRERENSSRQKRREQLCQQKGIGPALESRQSHSIEYGVYQIVPEKYWEGNKSPVVLRGSAAGRGISIPMCDQSTACNPDWHIRAPQSGCIGLHLILYSIHNIATDRRWEWLQLSTPPAKKQAQLTTRSSSLRCVSAAEHHTAEQYSKTGKTKPRQHLPMSNLSWNTRQDFLKTPRRSFSKVNLESNVTSNISRSTDSLAQYHQWLMGVAGDALCVTWKLS